MPADTTPSRFSSGPVTVAVDGAVFSGVVHAADPNLGLLMLELDEAPNLVPVEGTLLRLSAEGRTSFGSQAELLEVEDGQRWVLGVPSDLAPTQQRTGERLLADGAWQFHTADEDGVQTTMDLYDLSAGGLGLQFPTGAGPDRAGRQMMGTLVCEQTGRWKVSLESTNVRRHPDDPRMWIVGCRLVHLSEEGATTYAQILQHLT